jgi:hypothetical protein
MIRRVGHVRSGDRLSLLEKPLVTFVVALAVGGVAVVIRLALFSYIPYFKYSVG